MAHGIRCGERYGTPHAGSQAGWHLLMPIPYNRAVCEKA
jgi:hypothetical protein